MTWQSLRALKLSWRLGARFGAKGLLAAAMFSFGLSFSGFAAPSQPEERGSSLAQVRGFGNPDHLEFTGNTSFTPTDLRQALVIHARFLTAARPGAPLDEFLAGVQDELVSGYQRNGFPEAQVEVRPDTATERALINIHEGPRIRCRSVRVIGTGRAIASRIVSCLTSPPAATDDPGENPRWVPKEPACFDPGGLAALKKAAEARLAALGWFFPQAVLRIERLREAGAADLVVEIRDLGPPGVVQEFRVRGNHHNSTQDILRLLGLGLGSRVTSGSLSQWEAKLQSSGRFLESGIKAELPGPDARSPGIRLAIRVREYEAAPPLSSPLSARQQALLRVCDWLSHFGSHSGDASLTFAVPPRPSPAAYAGRLVLSPRHGTILNCDNDATGPIAGYSLLLSRSRLGILSPQHDRLLFIQRPDLSPTAWFSLSPNSAGGEDPFNLTFGLGWLWGTQAEVANDADAPVVSFNLLPAAFLHFDDDADGLCQIQNGVFTLTNRFGFLKADARTGEVLSYDSSSPDVQATLRFRKGDFTRALRAWDSQALVCSNSYLPEYPIGSLLSFFSGQLARHFMADGSSTNFSPARHRAALQALDRLFSVSVFAPLDTTNPPTSAAGFYIPKDDMDHALEQSGYPTVFPWLLARYGRGLCSPGSWGARLLMDGCLLCAHQSSEALEDMEELCVAPGAGPVRCLMAAEVAAYFKLHEARTFARRGLECLSTTGFRADCDVLFNTNSGPARCFSDMCAALRELPPTELEALSGSLPSESAAMLKAGNLGLRVAPAQPPTVFLGLFLDVAWNTYLRARVEEALRNVASPLPENRPQQ